MAEQNINNNKKNKISIRKFIYNDKYLIILSLILAVVVWIVTSISVGADENKTIKVDVPIKLSSQVSDQMGMQFYSLQDTVELSVKIKGPKYVVGQVSENDLNIKFDTSSIVKTGEQTIPIIITNGSDQLDYTVTDYYPSQIQGYFDVSETQTFSLTANYPNDFVAEGYTVGNPVLSEDEIVVTGPKGYVDKIKKAVININVDVDDDKLLTEPYTGEYPIEIVGDSIQTRYLKITSKTDKNTLLDKVSVTLPVLKKTQLPVNIKLDDKPSGLAKDAISIKYSVDKINAGILDTANIKTADIGEISFNQISLSGKQMDFDVTNLNGITVLDKDLTKITVSISVNSSYSQKNISINKTDLVIEGIKDGYTATAQSLSSPNIVVVGPKDSVDKINASNIVFKCDVSKEKEDNRYPVTVSLSDSKDCWIYGTYNAIINITK